MDCFADNARQVIGNFNENYEPVTQYLERAIDFIKNAPVGYIRSIPI
jgi:hypothetical protein